MLIETKRSGTGVILNIIDLMFISQSNAEKTSHHGNL